MRKDFLKVTQKADKLTEELSKLTESKNELEKETSKLREFFAEKTDVMKAYDAKIKEVEEKLNETRSINKAL